MKFRLGDKNRKLQLCRQHFLVEALLVIEPPNIVPPNENAVGTAVKFLIFFLRVASPAKTVSARALKFSG